MIIGGGVAGTNAAKIALGMGAHVAVIDRSLNRLRQLDDIFGGQIVTLASNAWTIGETLKSADLVVGAVLIPGASAPELVRREVIASGRRAALLRVEHAGGGAAQFHACTEHPGLRGGVNNYNGYVTHAGVAESQGRQWRELAVVV